MAYALPYAAQLTTFPHKACAIVEICLAVAIFTSAESQFSFDIIRDLVDLS